MTSCCPVLDLTALPPDIAPYRYVYARLRECAPGESLCLWSPEEPGLFLEQLQHQMRHTLVWSMTPDGRGWLIHVHIRSEEEALPLADTLRRDHETVDHRVVAIMAHLGRADWPQAVEATLRLGRALRAHIDLENELLAPLGLNQAPELTALMKREHDEIVAQLDILDEVAGRDQEACHELDTWLGLLAASLNKHEYREESLLFPHWTRALALRPDRDALLDTVRERLAAAS